MKKLQKFAFCLAALSLLGMAACNNSNEKNVTDDEDSAHAVVNGFTLGSGWGDAIVGVYYDAGYGTEDDYIECTGTLIHPKWVLTSASCLMNEASDDDFFAPEDYNDAPEIGSVYNKFMNGEVTIAFGSNMSELSKHQRKIKKVYAHEGYGETAVPHNDIALIELSKSISEDLVYPIAPIAPGKDLTRSSLEANPLKVTVAGFGEYGSKYASDEMLISHCGASDSDNVNGCNYYDKNVAFGTLYYENSKGILCGSVNGGPLIMNTNEFPGLAVAGVTSYSYTDGPYGKKRCSKFSVDTAVQDFYEDFILKYAPEVKSYHERRQAMINQEIQSGECGNELLRLCRVMNGDKEVNSCAVTEDKAVECMATCDEGICPLCIRDGIVSNHACDYVPEPEVPKRNCMSYDSIEVPHGSSGCIGEMQLAKCDDGNWVKPTYCWSDPNGVGSCSTAEGACKLTCNDKYVADSKNTQCILKEKNASDPDGCSTYDGYYVKKGEVGCIGHYLMGTCQGNDEQGDSRWTNLETCDFDENTKSSCSNNTCERKCKAGYINAEDGSCVSVRKGESCYDGETLLARDGEWYCYSEGKSAYLRQCVNGQIVTKPRRNCDACDPAATNRCAPRSCKDEVNTVADNHESFCFYADWASTCSNGEWVNYRECASGCATYEYCED